MKIDNRSKDAMLVSHRTFGATLHIVGEGRLPKINADLLTDLVTMNGDATRKILELATRGMNVSKATDRKVLFIEFSLPYKPEKQASLLEKNPPAFENRVDKSRRLIYKKYTAAGNSYGITGCDTSAKKFTIRILDTYTGSINGKDREFTDKLSANFLQAAFKSFLQLPFTIPDILLNPVLKQAAEMILSHVGLLVGDDQEAGLPNTEERIPEARLINWLNAVTTLSQRTEPFEYGTIEGSDGKPRQIIVSEDWVDFSKSPFVHRLPIKIEPCQCRFYIRNWSGDHNRSENGGRIYIAMDIFSGMDSVKYSNLDQKVFWWRKDIASFRPIMGSKPLRADETLLVIPLEYDVPTLCKSGSVGKTSRFISHVTDPHRKVCLVTLTEVRNNRMGRKNLEGKSRLVAPDRLWRINISTSKETPKPVWNKKVLGIHFAEKPVLSWSVYDVVSKTIVTRGTIDGNPALQRGLAEQSRNENNQKSGRWVDREYQDPLKELTRTIANNIVRLALEHSAWIVLEDIKWVQKSGSNSVANRRSSMWNYARLAEVIKWLGIDIATRDVGGGSSGKTAPVKATVSDYLVNYTCPRCGSCRKAKQDEHNSDTWLLKGSVGAGRELQCRNSACNYQAIVTPAEKADIVVKLGTELIIKDLAKVS